MSLRDLFTYNYDYLNTVAQRITRKRDYRQAPELLSTTYLTIHEKAKAGTILIPGENDEFVKWFCKCMKNYYRWPNSNFNKTHSRDNIVCHIDTYYEERASDFLVDEDALRDIEIQTEETNDLTKELIDISSSLGRDKTLRYIEVIEFKRTLESHESILFELYFEKEMSTREIAKEYSMEFNTINYQSINKMINIIKTKINNYKWKPLNS